MGGQEDDGAFYEKLRRLINEGWRKAIWVKNVRKKRGSRGSQVLTGRKEDE